MGLVLLARLRTFQQAYPETGDEHGSGLMIGTELTSPQREPWSKRAQAVTSTAMEEGPRLSTCGPWENAVRGIPPLIIGESHIEEALEKFERTLRASRSIPWVRGACALSTRNRWIRGPAHIPCGSEVRCGVSEVAGRTQRRRQWTERSGQGRLHC